MYKRQARQISLSWKPPSAPPTAIWNGLLRKKLSASCAVPRCRSRRWSGWQGGSCKGHCPLSHRCAMPACPPFVANATSPSGWRESFKGRAKSWLPLRGSWPRSGLRGQVKRPKQRKMLSASLETESIFLMLCYLERSPISFFSSLKKLSTSANCW